MAMGSPRARQSRNLAAGPFQPAIGSFRLHLNAEGKSPSTVTTYPEAVQWFAGGYLRAQTDRADWPEVTADDVSAWMVYLLERYADSYANNQYRALQQFFKWYSEDEELPNLMLRLKPQKVGVFSTFASEGLWLQTIADFGRSFRPSGNPYGSRRGLLPAELSHRTPLVAAKRAPPPTAEKMTMKVTRRMAPMMSSILLPMMASISLDC